ncbi:MAG: hypothetical protein RQ856_05495 [Candidatus Izemoplasmatales bacterium]|nr:hypothetical protein [Candidatus Izemoplasmatales bacterium]
MKKILILFNLLIVVLLSGCRYFIIKTTTISQTTLTSEIVDTTTYVSTTNVPTTISSEDFFIQKFHDSLSLYDFYEVNGFNYLSTQYINDAVVNYDEVEQRIVWEPEIKIYTDYYSERLKEFSIDETYEIIENVSFYYNNQIGTYNENDELIWKVSTLETYLDFILPVNDIELNYFESYEINESEGLIVLSGLVKIEFINTVLGLESSDIDQLNLTITINNTDYSLQSLNILYSQDLTETEIIFIPYYDITQVIIPQ